MTHSSTLPSWTGFYAGGNLGGTWTDYRVGSFTDRVDIVKQFDNAFPFDQIGIPTPAFDPIFVHASDSDSVSGSFFGGGQLGFSHQWMRLVIGLEGDFDGLSTSHQVSHPFSQSVTAGSNAAQGHGTLTREASSDWNASIRLRGGFTYGQWLFYVTGGPAFSEITGRADDIATTDFFMNSVHTGAFTSTNSSSDSDVLVGWTAGAGAELRLTQLFSVGLEYRYSNFGGHTFPFDNSHGSAINSGSTGMDASSHQATVRVNVLLSELFGKH